MGNTLTTVVAIITAVVLIIIFPLLTTSKRSDNITEISVEKSVTEFVDESRATGYITMNKYDEFVNKLNATGNSYEIEMEVKTLDENIGKKTAWTEGTVIGENVYYSIYNSQILNYLAENDVYLMKEGDIFSCTVKNKNMTLSQTLRGVFQSNSEKESYQIKAQHSGIVTASKKESSKVPLSSTSEIHQDTKDHTNHKWEYYSKDKHKCVNGEELENHDYRKNATIIKLPTCVSKGSKEYSCIKCGYSYKEEIDEGQHIPVYGGTKKVHTKCSVCGDILSDTHIYTEKILDATCTKRGAKEYTCECGYSYVEMIEKGEHKAVNGGTRDVHTKCSECGITLSSEHTYEKETLVEANNQTNGKIKHTCDCGYTYIETTDKTGHKPVYGGTKDVHIKCSECGVIINSEHTLTSKIKKKATCMNDGEMEYTCKCGYKYTEEIKATGHKEIYGGTKDVHTKCSLCGAVVSADHNYFKPTTIEQSTCTREGVREYICICGYSYTEPIYMLEHKETYGGTQYVHTKCSECGVTLNSNHNYTISRILVSPTCTKKGTIEYSCKCGYSYTDSIAKLEHDYELWSWEDSTCTSTGYARYECTRCDVGYSETLPKSDHTYATCYGGNSVTTSDSETTKYSCCGTVYYKSFYCNTCGISNWCYYCDSCYKVFEWATSKKDNKHGSGIKYCIVCGHIKS